MFWVLVDLGVPTESTSGCSQPIHFSIPLPFVVRSSYVFITIPLVIAGCSWILGLILKGGRSGERFLYYFGKAQLKSIFITTILVGLLLYPHPFGRTKKPQLVKWWYVLCKYRSKTLCKTGFCAVTLRDSLLARPMMSSDCWQLVAKGLMPFRPRWCAENKSSMK